MLRYYNKIWLYKTIGVCYWCVKIPQWGYIEHGLKHITFDNPGLVRDKPWGAPASVKLVYCFTELYQILFYSVLVDFVDTVVIIQAYSIAWACSLQSKQRGIETEIMSLQGLDLPAKWHVLELGGRIWSIKHAHCFLMLCFVLRYYKINFSRLCFVLRYYKINFSRHFALLQYFLYIHSHISQCYPCHIYWVKNVEKIFIAINENYTISRMQLLWILKCSHWKQLSRSIDCMQSCNFWKSTCIIQIWYLFVSWYDLFSNLLLALILSCVKSYVDKALAIFQNHTYSKLTVTILVTEVLT